MTKGVPRMTDGRVKNVIRNLPMQDGKVLPGPGRGKTPNRITGEAKKMIGLAFEGIGGLPGLMAWARDNRTAFYTQVYTKLIPVQISGKIDVEVNDEGEKARRQLEVAFLNVIAARRAGSEDPAVIVDGERVRDTGPQLAISSQAGADSAGVPEEREAVAELVVPRRSRRRKDTNGS